MTRLTSRRNLMTGALSGAALVALPAVGRAQASAKVLVIGGGFAGATAARQLRRDGFDVTLVEPNSRYLSCPFSNLVVTGLRNLDQQVFGYGTLEREEVRLVQDSAVQVDAAARRVTLDGGTVLGYDRLVLAPGIDIRFDVLPGYDAAAAEKLPHAWKAGAQTLLLRQQLEAMENGGTVVMSVPANPYRCPPGPYERASLIAHYLKSHKPRSKVVILDAKDTFSKQGLFTAAWKALYPDHLEWVGLSGGGKVIEVDAAQKTLVTEFGRFEAAVANVIPPQRAALIAQTAGVADRTGWCPIDPVTFESRLQPHIHVLGDACIAGAMPKSAFSANAQAKICAQVVAQMLRGQTPGTPKLVNTCYSYIAPDAAISIAGVYQPLNGLLTDVPGAGGISPATAPQSVRATEALYARAWFDIITDETFG
jgi:sulfide dehydrogenase [flavocytochrome c] flavoprotein chain